MTSSPAADDASVYVADDRALYAFDAQTGALEWRHEFGATLPHPGFQWDFFDSSPTVVGARIYIGSGDGGIYALNRKNGTTMWVYRTHGRVRSTPAVAGGTVYAGSFDGRLYALSERDGRLRWIFKTKSTNPGFPLGEIQSSPAVDRGIVFFGSRDSYLYALDARTGKQLWSHGEGGSWVVSSAAISGGVVYYGTSDGDLVRALDERTGVQRWSFDAQGRVWASPLIAGDRLYFGIGTAPLLWLDTRTGRVKGVAQSEGTIYSSAAIGGGMLYYTSDDGYVYALQ